MWGNAQGWLISLVLVAAIAGGLLYVGRLDRPTAPTALSADERYLAPLELPVARGVVMPELNGPPDATPHVRAAVDAFGADAYTYEYIARGHVPRNFDTLPAIDPIIRAAISPDVTLLLGDDGQPPRDVVTFRAARPSLDALRVLGACLIQAGLDREQRDRPAAVGYYNVALALGAKLADERLVHAELVGGLALMAEASQRLARLVDDPARREALAAVDENQRRFVQERVAPVWRVVGSIDDGTTARHAGDVFAFARDARERMWRVEATLALGRFRFRSPSRADAIAAQRTLERTAQTEPDPVVRQAAAAALGMTAADFRMLR